MRQILSIFKDIRKTQLQDRGSSPARLAEVDQMYGLFDGMLSRVRPHDDVEVLKEVMTSSDFEYAITEFVQRQMIPAYQEKGFDFELFMKPDTVPNFLTVTRYQRRAGLDDLEYVGEKGEPSPGSFVDATKRQYKVYVFEKQYDFSMTALVNDDIGYFMDLTREMGIAARRSIEKFVSRMLWNVTTVGRLVALLANFNTTGRLTSARIATARMAFKNRVDTRGNPLNVELKYIVHATGYIDTIRTIRASQLVPELATNAVNVIRGDFIPIEDVHNTSTAPALEWMALGDWHKGVVPFVLARRAGVPAPMIMRKKSDQEIVASLFGAGGAVSPIFGDFATANIVFKVHDEWGTYIDSGVTGTAQGNLFDTNGAYYGSGVIA